MIVYRLAALLFFLMLSSCSENRVVVDSSGNSEFMEISNPAYTLTANAPATIWVPRESAENGIPRGGIILKNTYEAVLGEMKGTQQKGIK